LVPPEKRLLTRKCKLRKTNDQLKRPGRIDEKNHHYGDEADKNENLAFVQFDHAVLSRLCSRAPVKEFTNSGEIISDFVTKTCPAKYVQF